METHVDAFASASVGEKGGIQATANGRVDIQAAKTSDHNVPFPQSLATGASRHTKREQGD